MALRFSHCLRAVCALNCLLAALFAAALLPASASSPRPATSALFGKVPLAFEANQGQADKAVRFLSRGPGYSLFLTDQQAVFSLSRAGRTSPSVLKMTLAGAKPAAMIAGQNKLPGVANYYRGHNPSHWQTNVPTYREVRYSQVYKGVDLAYYGTGRQLEYDFRLAPGADAKQIQLTFDGARRLHVSKDGGLTVGLDGGSVRWQKPLVYQSVNGKRTEVTGQYAVRGRQVGFQLGAYDKSKPLVIDPVLVYSTYLGNSSGESATAVAASSTNGAYVTGYTDGATFPGQTGKLGPGGNTDVFVTRFALNGKSIVYSTVIGSTGRERPGGIALNSAGEAFIVGDAGGKDFPVVGNTSPFSGFADGFAAKLKANGVLAWARFIGGNSGVDVQGIAWTVNGLYICGGTSSTDFPPATDGFQSAPGGTFAEGNYSDGYIARLSDVDGTPLGGTYLGGINIDFVNSIAVSGTSVAVSGYTLSKNFPLVNAAQTTSDQNGYNTFFVASLSSDLKRARFSTYLGSHVSSTDTSVAIEASDNVYVGGTAETASFPTTAGAFRRTYQLPSEGFVTKYSASGEVLFSTFIGGSSQDVISGLAFDPSKSGIWVTGDTASGDFGGPPYGAFPSGANSAAFAARLDVTGKTLSNVFFFGSAGKTNSGKGIALDTAGAVYIAGYTGGGLAPLLNSYQSAYGGGDGDAFLAKIDPTAAPVALRAFNIIPNEISAGQPATFEVTLTAAPSADVSVPIVDKATGLTLTTLVVLKNTTSASVTLPRNIVGFFTYKATLGTVVKEATLKVNAVPGSVKSVTLAPNPVQGGSSTTGTVTLYNAAPTGGSKVTLSSSNTAIAFPALASVTVLAGKTTATFIVKTKPVLGPVKVNIIAKAPVGPAIDGALTVLAPSLKAFTVSPTILYGGRSVTGTLTLTGPAPAGLYVSVSSSTTSVVVPAKVLVAAGAASATFPITTSRVSATTVATLRATYGTTTLPATLTLYPIVKGGYFTVTDLGTLGGSSSEATNLNDSGQVVGFADTKPNSKGVSIAHGFLYGGAPSAMTDLFPNDVSSSDAYGINSQGQIVGSRLVNGLATPYLFTPTVFPFPAGKTASLGLPPGYIEALATSINALGKIVGTAGLAPSFGFLYSDRKYTRLATPAGFTILTASDINDAGQIAGHAESTIRKSAALVYKSGAITLLPLLTGTRSGASGAFAINAAGTLVGYCDLAPDGIRKDMVLWRNGQIGYQIVDLGSLPYYDVTKANDLNDTDQVVGTARDSKGVKRAVFYSDNVPLIDLNTRLLPGSAMTLTKAAAINNRGQIAGTGEIGGKPHAFLLNPLPAAPVSLTLSNTRIYAGEIVTGTLTLTVPAPTGGLMVSLVSSDGQHALVPASLTIPVGKRTLTFTVNTEDIRSGELAVKVRAIVNGIAADATLTLVPHPFALAGLSFNPNPVKHGANVTGTLSFFGISPSGVTVEVRSSGALLKRYIVPAGVFDATVSEVLPTALLPASARPVAYPVDAQLFINGKATGAAISTKLTVNP